MASPFLRERAFSPRRRSLPRADLPPGSGNSQHFFRRRKFSSSDALFRTKSIFSLVFSRDNAVATKLCFNIHGNTKIYREFPA